MTAVRQRPRLSDFGPDILSEPLYIGEPPRPVPWTQTQWPQAIALVIFAISLIGALALMGFPIQVFK